MTVVAVVSRTASGCPLAWIQTAPGILIPTAPSCPGLQPPHWEWAGGDPRAGPQPHSMMEQLHLVPSLARWDSMNPALPRCWCQGGVAKLRTWVRPGHIQQLISSEGPTIHDSYPCRHQGHQSELLPRKRLHKLLLTLLVRMKATSHAGCSPGLPERGRM